MSHCHDEVISHRMQICIMRVGWRAPNVEPTVSHVAVSIDAYLRDTEINVIAIDRRLSRSVFAYCGRSSKTGLLFRSRRTGGDKSKDQALSQNCCLRRPVVQHFEEHLLSNLLRPRSVDSLSSQTRFRFCKHDCFLDD